MGGAHIIKPESWTVPKAQGSADEDKCQQEKRCLARGTLSIRWVRPHPSPPGLLLPLTPRRPLLFSLCSRVTRNNKAHPRFSKGHMLFFFCLERMVALLALGLCSNVSSSPPQVPSQNPCPGFPFCTDCGVPSPPLTPWKQCILSVLFVVISPALKTQRHRIELC